MSKITFEEMCERYEDCEPPEFGSIKNKLSTARDVHAFALVAGLFPDVELLIGAYNTGDKIYFDIDIDELNKKATEQQMLELVICGVFIDSCDTLAMHV